MAVNYKYSGKRVPVNAATGAIASSAFCVQEGLFGVALNPIASGGTGQLGIEGVWHLPVPSGTVKGDVLYAPATPATAGVAVALTKTATANTRIGRALAARGTDNAADVLLFDNGFN
jgi:predicted RecA/RadA family phage recombinase